MIAEPHPDDANLVELDIGACRQRIPQIPFVSVIRIYDTPMDHRNGEIKESWSYQFLINRLAADGAFDGSAITPDERFTIATRTISGQRLFIQSAPLP